MRAVVWSGGGKKFDHLRRHVKVGDRAIAVVSSENYCSHYVGFAAHRNGCRRPCRAIHRRARREIDDFGVRAGDASCVGSNDNLAYVEQHCWTCLTQAQLATLLDMQQPAVSRLERQADMYLSTLRSYIEAMGGTLQLEAVFPDATVTIAMLGDLAEDPEAHPEAQEVVGI
jgi:hypothetical protein